MAGLHCRAADERSASPGDSGVAAAPLHAADGAVIGAVGLSTSASEASLERLALAAHLGQVIDRELTYREQIRAGSLDRPARKQAHEALRRSEANLRMIADRAPT